MQVGLNYPIATVFILYITIVLGLGLIAASAVKNMSDYILAGRNLSGRLAALGAGASDMSQWLLMSVPGAVFVNGVNQIWILIGLSFGAYLNWQIIAKRLRIFTEVANDSLTMPAYLDNRFKDNSKFLRRTTAIVVLFFFTVYAAAGFVAGALVTQSIFHISYLSALILSAGVIILYTCIGGFIAISWVDFFQGTLMLLAILVVPTMVIFNLNGLHATYLELTQLSQHHFDAFYGLSALSILSLLGWGLGYAGQPHIITRFMAIRDANEIPLAKFICMTWMILALYGALFTGLTGAAYTHATHLTLANPETIFLVLSDILFNPWVAGFLIAAVLSAVMSTVSAQLLLAASAISEDCYRDFIRPRASQRELIIVARVGVIAVSMLAVIIAAYSAEKTILSIVAYAWSGLGAAFGPVILMSLYWRRMTTSGAVAGIISGAGTVIAWEYLNSHVGGIFNLYSLLPAFCVSLMMIYLVSQLSRPPHRVVLSQYDEALKAISNQ